MDLKRIIQRTISLFLILLLLFPSLTLTVSAVGSAQTVRIGYFPMDGFHEYDEKGNPYGYDVDYLEQIAQYTHWKYEYVRVESWDQALEMLENGQVDLVGSAQITPERMARFDYGNYSAGSTFAAMMALSGNDAIVYEDFNQFQQAKFGCVKTYVRKNDFLTYAQQNGFTPQITYYDSTAKMRDALNAKEIDIMVASVMEISNKEKIVGKFSHAPFYYITTKGNEQLLTQLNDAMANIKLNSPDFENELFLKYYGKSKEVQLNRLELDYIKEHPVIRIGCFTNRSPLSYYNAEQDEFQGISKDILDWMEKYSGLTFTYVTMPPGTNPIQFLQSGKVDLVAGMLYGEANLQNEDLALTIPYFSSNMVLLAPKGNPFSADLNLTIAIPTGFQACEKYVAKNFPYFKIVNYPGTEECLDAVLQGKADLLIQNYYILNEYLANPRYKNMAIVPGSDTTERLCIGGLSTTDPMLLTILNKSIQRVPDSTINQILINHAYTKTYEPTFFDFIYQYRVPLVLLFIILLLIATAIILLWWEKRKRFLLTERNERMLQNIANNINGGVITIVPDNNLVINYANDGFLALIGYTREEYFNHQEPRLLPFIKQNPQEILPLNWDENKQITLEFQLQHKDGHFIPVLMRGTMSADEEKRPMLFCVIVDVTEQKKMIQELKEEKERYHLLIDQSDSIFFDFDLKNKTILTSPMFRKKFGWDTSSWSTIQHLQKWVIHPDDADLTKLYEEVRQKKRNSVIDLRLQTADGSYVWCRLTLGYFYENNTLLRLIGKIEDIDCDMKERERLENKSKYDHLTHLYNRQTFRFYVEKDLEDPEPLTGSALYFLDLDNFKSLNDTLGHLAGDQALIDTANLLKQIFRKEDIIGRFGGDEFYIWSRNIPLDVVKNKALQICETLYEHFEKKQDQSITVSASVGIAYFPDDGTDYDTLIKKADSALYYSKKHGKNTYSVFRQTED